jgi:CRISPR system Cascade subunit CasC
MLVELHLLQNFAPSCLNRDDTNAPKDCLFGGVRRARISSQCLKRAIRWHPLFLQTAGGLSSVRTRRLVERLCADLHDAGHAAEQVERVVPAVVQRLIGQLTPQGRTRALIHLGEDEIARLGELIRQNWEALSHDDGRTKTGRSDPLARLVSDMAAQFQSGTLAADIALFGRMVAENAHLNVEAACQIAHAISTHRIVMEMDFFSAVDDLKAGSGPAAEMIGTTEFNSACFYRYAAVSVRQLLANLDGEAERCGDALAGFLHAAIAAVPAGRQTSMAASNPPSFILGVVREGAGGWSLVNAFEHPVTVTAQDRRGLVRRSVSALDDYWGKLADMYSEAGVVARPACWLDDCEMSHLTDQRVRQVRELVETTLHAAGFGG